MNFIKDFVNKVGGKNIQIDSRQILPGDVFLAHRGEKIDGHTFIDDAVNKGAIAVIGENNLNLSIPYLKISNSRLAWSEWQAYLAGNPEKLLRIIGVTGTDGKTTTASLIYKILSGFGKSAGMISTIEAVYGNKKIDTGSHTSTPSAEVLFPILKEMIDFGVEWLVIETTSHGLAQERIGGIKFEYGVLTNIGSDHLEYHGNLENYIQAKSKLFEKSEVSILNQSTNGVEVFAKKAAKKIIYYDSSKQIRNQKYIRLKGKLIQSFELLYGNDWMEVKTELLGKYNIENILAASKIAEDLRIPSNTLISAIESFKSPKGRQEWIENNRGINIVVDFAHTEQGLRAILELINLIKKNEEKVITVFGANGERDRTKRSPMGMVAAELANIVIITSEDTNNESIDQIYNDIKIGYDSVNRGHLKKMLRIDDRENAIETALKIAKKGDWVLCLGKGHEKSMNIDGIERPWDEVGVINRLLKDTI